MALPLALASDLAETWRTLTLAEETRATALIEQVERRIRRKITDLDEKIADGRLDEAGVRDVVVTVVRRAMLADGQEGVMQASQTTGPFASSQTYANPMGNIYLTDDDWMHLGLDVNARRVGSMQLRVP